MPSDVRREIKHPKPSGAMKVGGRRRLRVAWGIRAGASLRCDVLGYGREPGSCYGRACHLFSNFSGVF